MQVPDALSRKPHTESEIQDLLRMDKDKENDSDFKIKITTKSGKQKHVYFTLHSKRHSRARGTVQPHELEIPKVFDYENDPDYGEIYKRLTSDDPKKKPLPSDTLYHIRENNLVWVDKHMKPRICVPRKYRATLCREHHDTPLGGHFGMEKTLHSI